MNRQVYICSMISSYNTIETSLIAMIFHFDEFVMLLRVTFSCKGYLSRLYMLWLGAGDVRFYKIICSPVRLFT